MKLKDESFQMEGINMTGNKLSKWLPYYQVQCVMSYCTVPGVSNTIPPSSVCTAPIVFQFHNPFCLSVHFF